MPSTDCIAVTDCLYRFRRRSVACLPAIYTQPQPRAFLILQRCWHVQDAATVPPQRVMPCRAFRSHPLGLRRAYNLVHARRACCGMIPSGCGCSPGLPTACDTPIISITTYTAVTGLNHLQHCDLGRYIHRFVLERRQLYIAAITLCTGAAMGWIACHDALPLSFCGTF